MPALNRTGEDSPGLEVYLCWLLLRDGTNNPFFMLDHFRVGTDELYLRHHLLSDGTDAPIQMSVSLVVQLILIYIFIT